MNGDTLMCERHEANYIQSKGNKDQNYHDLHSHQTYHDPNDPEKSLTELNNDMKNDLEHFKSCIRSMKIVHDKLFARDDSKTTCVDDSKTTCVLPNKKSKLINQEPQSKTNFEKLITNFLDGQRVTNMFVKNNNNDMILKMKQNEKNFQTKIKNMERKIDEWSKSQKISSEQTDRTDPPPSKSHTEHVNVVFTGSEKSNDSLKTLKDPPLSIIAEAVNTACYVQNRVLVVKPNNKNPYELFHSRTPTLGFIRPFKCPVTILNTIDHLDKFDGKADEGFFVGYSLNSKAFRVFNSKARIVEENLHIRFSENTPNVIGTKASDNAGQARKETEPIKDYILLPLWTADLPFSQNPKSSYDYGSKPSSDDGKKVDEDPRKENECNDQEKEDNIKNTNNVNNVSSTVNNANTNEDNELSFDPNMPAFEDVSIFNYINDDEDDGIATDINNLDTTIQVSSISTTRIHKDHPIDQVIRDLQSTIQTRKMSKNLEEHRSMSGSLMYLTSLRPDIMFAVCACARYQVNIKVSHLHDVKGIFRVTTGGSKLMLLGKLTIFWSTTLAKTINEEVHLHAKVDGKKIIVTESSVRRDLRLADEEDEAVHKELGDKLVRAATIASSLEAEQDSGGGPRCQETIRDTNAQTRFESVSKYSNDSLLAKGNTLRSDKDRLELLELMVLCTNLQTMVLDLEKTKTTQSNEISSLKRRVKKLEKRNRSRTHKLKRLYKVGLTVRVESSDGERVRRQIGEAATNAFSLEAEQDNGNIAKTQSKATPNEPSSQGTNSGGGPRCQETMKDTTAQTRFESVSKHSNDSLLAGGNTLQSNEDRLKLNELMALCTNLQIRVLDLEKTKTTQKSSDKESLGENASKQGKRIDAIDQDEDITLVNIQNDAEMFDVNDLGGEEEQKEPGLVKKLLKGYKLNLMRKKDLQERAQKEQEANIALIETWDDIQAKIDADHQLAERLQAQEQEELYDAGKATLFQQLLEKRRKHFAAKRA
uniref:Retrovirus-related Pol polyprotein from transposon TNT 1-94 n=1 Tax=Tanacetum cinerariifolium TaxID=118510 RepID=A0A6L2LPP6_TANCI|nr:retrovirus-related Pol polyprotein from transposon TNT 1-94 [Tanacetum cinerariifolium]